MTVLFCICTNPDLDLVGHHVFNKILHTYPVTKIATIDPLCNIYLVEKDYHKYYIMQTNDFVMHNTQKYLDILLEYFADIEVCVHVNYHAGASAPDNVLCVHHVGDITSANFLPYNPQFATNLIVHMERIRKQHKLLDFTVESETTHWSGIVSNQDPAILQAFPINTIDLEIGSDKAAFNNQIAIDVIVESMFEIFNTTDEKRLNLLYIGGAHFEKTYTKAILDEHYPIYLSHQLCGLWVVNENYETHGLTYLSNLIELCEIKYDAIIYHEKAKKLKPVLEQLVKKYDISLYKYNALKNIETSELNTLYK